MIAEDVIFKCSNSDTAPDSDDTDDDDVANDAHMQRNDGIETKKDNTERIYIIDNYFNARRLVMQYSCWYLLYFKCFSVK